MNPFLDKGIFKQLRDTKVFNTVHVSFDTIEWTNGADLCPELLYKESKVISAISVCKTNEPLTTQ